jgi:hypothetical protein
MHAPCGYCPFYAVSNAGRWPGRPDSGDEVSQHLTSLAGRKRLGVRRSGGNAERRILSLSLRLSTIHELPDYCARSGRIHNPMLCRLSYPRSQLVH